MFVHRWTRLAGVWLVVATLAMMPALAATIGVNWDTSADATGYRLHYGTESGNYTEQIDVGNSTSHLLTNLVDCSRYYPVVTAYNDAGSSGFSGEAASLARPDVTDAAPPSAEQGRQLDVTLTGSNFDAGATVSFTSSGLQVDALSIASCNQMVLSLSVAEGADIGTTDVQIVNPSGTTGNLTALFTVEPTVAPTVVSTTPTDAATGVAVDVQPTVVFSEPMLAGSITASFVRLLDQGGLPVAQGSGSPSLSGDGRTATIVPASDLAQGGNFRIQVLADAAGARDLAGHPLAAMYLQSSGFNTVADLTPPQVSVIAVEALASTTAGVTWTTDEPADSQVFYRKTGDLAYQESALDGNLVTAHSVPLEGLMPSTQYQYHVASTDAGGNTTTSADDTFTTQSNSFTYITFEAELGALETPVGITSGSQAFGGAWIDTPGSASGTSGNPAGTATFGVNVPSAGAWYLWVRMYGQNGSSNSWFEAMNGSSRVQIATTTNGVWQWIEGRSHGLVQGLNDLELGGRDGGARADRVLLTDDPGFVPTEQPGADTLPTGSVASFVATRGDGEVQLDWSNPNDSDFDLTVVRYRTDGRFPVSPDDGFAVVSDSGAPGSSGTYTHTGLTNGQTYHYSAFAVDEAGNVAPAATGSAIPATVLLPPLAPGNVQLN
jgi:hypothetical protein